MSDHLRIVVGVPSGIFWQAQFGVDLVNMFNNFTMNRVPGYRSQELRLVNVRSSIISNNRVNIVKAAKTLHAHYVLFLDSDHTFPPDLIHSLVAHGKLVVAANCVTKQLPAQTTARQQDEWGPGSPVFTDDKKGLEQVWRVGTGVMLVNMKVFDKVPMDAWKLVWKEEVQEYQGEDWTFCQACEDARIPIFVDHDVSRKVGHIGNLVYTHDFVGEVAHAS